MSWEVPTCPRSEHVAQETASTPHARAESGRRAAQGSAGIELNQCGTDIGFCTFSRGRGDKGAAIYMQARPRTPSARQRPAAPGPTEAPRGPLVPNCSRAHCSVLAGHLPGNGARLHVCHAAAV